MLDAELLAEVYGELTGGRQQSLTLSQNIELTAAVVQTNKNRNRSAAPVIISDTELESHRAFISSLGAKPFWRRYLGLNEETTIGTPPNQGHD